MVAARRPRRPNGTPHAPTRSIRVEDRVWQPALRRANHENVTMSYVVFSFVKAYGAGLLNLPKSQPLVETKPAEEVASE